MNVRLHRQLEECDCDAAAEADTVHSRQLPTRFECSVIIIETLPGQTCRAGGILPGRRGVCASRPV